MAEVGEIRAKITVNNSEFKKKMNETRNDMNNTGKSARRVSKDISMITQASAAVGVAVAGAFAASVTVAANFEQKMKDVEAVSGATGEEMQRLGDLAKEMGQKTAFSASESAMAIEELIKAGLTVEQVINGGLEGALNLAIAGNLQLAEAAEIASTALNAFKDDGLSVTDAANVLAGAANASATSVQEMKFGLAQVSAVAAGAGLSFNDTATALAAFANNGLKGSDAGTSLKTMLQNLQPRTKEQIELFEELGLMTEDGANAFYDMNGEIKSMDQIAGLLQNAMKDMTDQQRAFALETIFGSDAVRAGNILYKEGAEGLNNMWDAMSKVTAADVATTKMETLQGAFTELTSSLETFGISLAEDALAPLAQLIRLATGVVRGIDDVDMASIKAGLAFAGTAAAIGVMGGAIAKLIVTFRTLALAMGPGGWILTGLSLIGGALAASKVAQSEYNEVSLESVDAMMKQKDALGSNIDEYDSLRGRAKLTNDELARFVDINSEMSKTANPEVLKKLRDEQELLREKSGLSNEQLQRLVELNDDIVAAVPESNTVLSEQGNILLENTGAAKDYNAEQAEMIRLELEAQRTKLEADMKGLLQDEKRLISEMKDEKQKMIDLDKEEADQLAIIGGIQDELARAKEADDQSEIQHLTFKLATENLKLQKLKDQKAEQAEIVLEKKKELDDTQKQIGKLDEVKQRMVNIELSQAGINAKKGEEMKTLDAELTTLYKQRNELDNIKDKAQRNTEEYRNAKKEIDGKIAKLEGVRSKISEIIGTADVLNSRLGQDIRKRVYIDEYGGRTFSQARRAAEGVGASYHTGGLVGRGQMPKLHVGGLASQFANAPLHNEIDVRLLRNEMVLTESQQANLMRMIDAGPQREQANAGPVNVMSAPAQPVEIPVILNGREIARAAINDINALQKQGADEAKARRGIRNVNPR